MRLNEVQDYSQAEIMDWLEEIENANPIEYDRMRSAINNLHAALYALDMKSGNSVVESARRNGLVNNWDNAMYSMLADNILDEQAELFWDGFDVDSQVTDMIERIANDR